MMNYGEWYVKVNARYKQWRSKWNSRIYLEHAALYGLPSILMIVLLVPAV